MLFAIFAINETFQENPIKNAIRKISLLLLLGTFAFNITACNTMAGVGKDTQKAGEKIEKEAERHTDDKN